MVKTSIQYIKEAANKLVNSKLQDLETAETQEILKGVMQTVGLETIKEVCLFVALFDRTSADNSSNMSDLSSYFSCSSLDMMEYIPVLKTLKQKGFIVPSGRKKTTILAQEFVVNDSVISAVIENKPITIYPTNNDSQLSKYDFCNYISSEVENEDITTNDLVDRVEAFENNNTHIPFVIELRSKVRNITDRILFYDVCHDHFEQYGKYGSDLSDTLNDIYDNIKQRISIKKSIKERKHILITLNLVELKDDDDELTLTDYGKDCFYGEDLSAFVQSYKCEDIYIFIKKLTEFFCGREYNSDSSSSVSIINKYITRFENDNKHLPTVQHIRKSIPNEYDRLLFYFSGDDLINDNLTFLSHNIKTIYTISDRKKVICALKDKTHFLQKQNLVDIEKNSSIFGESTCLILTDKGKEELLGEDASMYINEVSDKNLLKYDKIADKPLFFSPDLEKQLSLLRNSLNEQYYEGLCQRLEEKKLPKGMAILLYGKPGTGKTESVMQIAKSTGRNIMHVDISATKSCWFGESEKLIKKVFTDYRRICEKSTIKPILLFNEADAIFSKRKDVNDSGPQQTENAIQNIILEEMENLDGILIATTNLADNLDKAFERRFLFKIYFDMPTIEAKISIWRSKLPSLSVEDAQRLASSFEFSGGQIDNIVRKSLMQEIISNNKPTITDLITMCNEEKISKKNNKKMGFC